MDKVQLLKSLKQEGFSKSIIDAFSKVKRENFITENMKSKAYEDTALPIGEGQTISQPYTTATMLSLLSLKKSQRVLEIGSGCGYVLALMSKIVGNKGKIFGVEIIKSLTDKSKINLQNYKNIIIYNKNGAAGLKEEALFDRIIISAACEEIPAVLTEQLEEGGIIVAPVGSQYEQTLTSFQKVKGELEIREEIPGFIFVPFV
ncbi:MAG: protein-L-isoaspartate O-methyltransferase [Nanoarchaeota archaeon]